MDINSTLSSVLYLVITTILPVLATYLVKFVKAKIEEKTALIDNEYAKNVVEDVSNIILEAIEATNQTYVDELKKNGEFTKEAHDGAMRMTLEKVYNLVSLDTIKFISQRYEDFDFWVRNKVEYLIKINKK